MSIQQDDGNVALLCPLLQQAPTLLVWLRKAFDDDGPDELAVDHAASLVEDDQKVGVFLVDGVQSGETRRVLYERLKGFAMTDQGDECDVGVPLVQEVGHHLCREIERAFLVGGADALDGSIFETGDLFEIICHNLFFGKGRVVFGKKVADIKGYIEISSYNV